MDQLQGIPLNALRAAEVVARKGSLRAAGAELGVSPGAVSQQLARAEAGLGRSLFDRKPGGMVPAQGTEELFVLLREGFARLGAAVDSARRDRTHILTISVAPIFAARWLIWRLPEFTRAHPEIRVRIDSAVQLVNPGDGDVDFAIRIGRGPYAGLRVEKLLTQRVTPVCARDWAERIASPRDLARVPIIRDLRAMFGWEVWLTPEGAGDVTLPEGPEFTEASLGLDAAMAGEGVLLAFETLCHDALARGQVVAPLPRWHATGLSYWLVSAEDRSLSGPQRQFRTWLRGALAASGMGG